MEQAEILAPSEAAGAFFAVVEVRTSEGYRHDRAGAGRDVTVEIGDGGVGDPLRAHVVVTDDGGPAGTGRGGRMTRADGPGTAPAAPGRPPAGPGAVRAPERVRPAPASRDGHEEESR